MTNNFRTIALALRDHVDGTYNLLDAADAVEKVIPNLEGVPTLGQTLHEHLVNTALRDPEAMQHMRECKKINAIKRLRLIGSCGLREAREAVEDERVINATGYTPAQPYSAWTSDYESRF